MLASAADTVRLTLHILAATIWVGGQIVLGALVPALRRAGADTRAAAQAYARIAWPAFFVLVLTGIWNIAEIPTAETTGYHAVLDAKMAVVVLSGAAAFLHQRATTKKGLAIWGAVSGLAALTAVTLGVLLAG